MKNFPTLVRITAESIIKQAIPPIGVCAEIYSKFQEEKFNFFLDEVQRGTADISVQNLNDYDILHTAYITQQALLKIRQREKIKLLADLFISYCHKLRPDYNEITTDKYEIFLTLLDGISGIEFEILAILYKYETSTDACYKGIFKTEYDHYRKQCGIWVAFIDTAKRSFNLSNHEIGAYLQRLSYTGLFVKFIYYTDKGYLTPLFYELINFLKKDAGYE